VREQVPTACFVQPPVSFVGLSEEEAVEQLSGPLDIYSSLFRPLKNTLSGREEKTFVKMIVHVPTDRVRLRVVLVLCHVIACTAPADASNVVCRVLACIWGLYYCVLWNVSCYWAGGTILK
jgi:Pyridine nucleotide-disulphide oxidoreductase, dimerisation domain